MRTPFKKVPLLRAGTAARQTIFFLIFQGTYVSQVPGLFHENCSRTLLQKKQPLLKKPRVKAAVRTVKQTVPVFC
jgi:hypothetical protein